MFKNGIISPLQSFNKRGWIVVTAVVAERGILGTLRKTPEQLHSVMLAVAAAAEAIHGFLCPVEVMFQETWILEQ